jgi:hypothetical protein
VLARPAPHICMHAGKRATGGYLAPGASNCGEHDCGRITTKPALFALLIRAAPPRTAATVSSWPDCGNRSAPGLPPETAAAGRAPPPLQTARSGGCRQPSQRALLGDRCAVPAVVPRWAGPQAPELPGSSRQVGRQRVAALPCTLGRAAAWRGRPAAGSCNGGKAGVKRAG